MSVLVCSLKYVLQTLALNCICVMITLPFVKAYLSVLHVRTALVFVVLKCPECRVSMTYSAENSIGTTFSCVTGCRSDILRFI